MDRRSFLKVISALGVVASGLDAAIPEFKEYPSSIEYKVNYVIEKRSYLHIMYGKGNDGTQYYVANYCDEEVLPAFLLKDMMHEIKYRVGA